MARRGGTSRTAGRLSKLRERVDALRRSRMPDALVVEVWEDDERLAAEDYLRDLEAFFARHSSATVIVTVKRLARRPEGRKPPWQPPRAWLDTREGAAPPGGFADGSHRTESSSVVAR